MRISGRVYLSKAKLPHIYQEPIAEACGGNGYAIREPNEVKSVMHKAMSERNKPIIIEAYVDPFEPPMPPKVHTSFVCNVRVFDYKTLRQIW